MTRIKALLFAAAMLIAPGVALAQGESPRWSYVEGGFIDFDPDEGLSDDGWYAGASFRIFKHFHIVGEYQDVGDYTFWNAGGGWHGLLGEPADLFGQILWTNVEIDDGDVDEDGYDLQAGVRWKLAKWLELSGQVNWVDYGGDVGDDTTFEVGGLFSFLNDRMGVGARFETGGDADTARVYYRFHFGK
jgi:hypothetical protein